METEYSLDIEALQYAPALGTISLGELVRESIFCVAGLAECFEYEPQIINRLAGELLNKWQNSIEFLGHDQVEVVQSQIEEAVSQKKKRRHLRLIQSKLESELESENEELDGDFNALNNKRNPEMIFHHLKVGEEHLNKLLEEQIDFFTNRLEKNGENVDLKNLLRQAKEVQSSLQNTFLSIYSRLHKNGIESLGLWAGVLDSILGDYIQALREKIISVVAREDELNAIEYCDENLEVGIEFVENIFPREAADLSHESNITDRKIIDVVRLSVAKVMRVAERCEIPKDQMGSYITYHLDKWRDVFSNLTLEQIRSLPRSEASSDKRYRVRGNGNLPELEEFIRDEIIVFMERREREMTRICKQVAEEIELDY